MEKFEFEGKVYDARHGGPFDRGSADSWYSRPVRPHFFTGATRQSEEITEPFMTPQQIDEYMAGYLYNEQSGHKKVW